MTSAAWPTAGLREGPPGRRVAWNGPRPSRTRPVPDDRSVLRTWHGWAPPPAPVAREPAPARWFDRLVHPGPRWVLLYLAAVPVLWPAGLLLPLGAVVLTLPLVARWPRWPSGFWVNVAAFSWIVVAVCQGLAAWANWSTDAVGAGSLIGHLLSLEVIGWLFIGLGVASGMALFPDRRALARVTALTGVYFLVLIGAGLCLILAVHMPLDAYDRVAVPSLIGALLPGDGLLKRTFFTVALMNWEESGGIVTPRFILFFPWPTALGLAGIAVSVVSLEAKGGLLRWLGVAGGAVAVLASVSRSAIALLLMAHALRFFLSLRPTRRFVLAAAGTACVATGLIVTNLAPLDRLTSAWTEVNGARAGSSMARELIYARSWEGFLRSPLYGNGWIGGSVIAEEELPVGSHSTVFGLLYTGGAMTFGAYALALGATAVALVRRGARNGALRSTLPLILTFAVFSVYESMFSYGLPCMILFLWLGAGLRAKPRRSPLLPGTHGHDARVVHCHTGLQRGALHLGRRPLGA